MRILYARSSFTDQSQADLEELMMFVIFCRKGMQQSQSEAIQSSIKQSRQLPFDSCNKKMYFAILLLSIVSVPCIRFRFAVMLDDHQGYHIFEHCEGGRDKLQMYACLDNNI